jgi:hypothetical protein
LCWSYTTYPTITSAVTLITGDTVTIRVRTPGKDDQSQPATTTGSTFNIAAISSFTGTGTNLIYQPNVLLYYKTPITTNYFGNALVFTFTNALTMATGNFVATYAASFSTPFTVTAVDTGTKLKAITTVSASSASMMA